MRSKFRQADWQVIMGVSLLLTPPLMANINGPQTQNLAAAPSSADHVSVGSAAVIGQGVISSMGLLHLGFNELPYFDVADQGSRTKIDNIVGHFDAGLTYGLSDRFDLGLTLHTQLVQTGTTENQSHGQYASAGLTGLSFVAKYQVMKNDLWSMALRAVPFVQLMSGSPYDGKPGLNALTTEVLMDIDLLRNLILSTNLGYRTSLAKDISANRDRVLAFGNAYTFSSALAWKWNERHSVIGEVYALAPQKSEFDRSDRHTTRSEALIAHRQQLLPQHTKVTYGLSSELQHSISSADWRVFVGATYDVVPQKSAPKSEPIPMMSFHESEIERQPDEIITIEDVLFRFNSDQIADMTRADQQLESLVKALRRDGGYEKLVIEGHTCSIGKEAYNQRLSQRRAMKIKAMLAQRFGFRASTIRARGLGEKIPIASNVTEAGRQENRRVEFKIFRKSELVGRP